MARTARYELSQIVGQQRGPRATRGLSPIPCDCPHGKHGFHYVRIPEGRTNPRRIEMMTRVRKFVDPGYTPPEGVVVT